MYTIEEINYFAKYETYENAIKYIKKNEDDAVSIVILRDEDLQELLAADSKEILDTSRIFISYKARIETRKNNYHITTIDLEWDPKREGFQIDNQLCDCTCSKSAEFCNHQLILATYLYEYHQTEIKQIEEKIKQKLNEVRNMINAKKRPTKELEIFYENLLLTNNNLKEIKSTLFALPVFKKHEDKDNQFELSLQVDRIENVGDFLVKVPNIAEFLNVYKTEEILILDQNLIIDSEIMIFTNSTNQLIWYLKQLLNDEKAKFHEESLAKIIVDDKAVTDIIKITKEFFIYMPTTYQGYRLEKMKLDNDFPFKLKVFQKKKKYYYEFLDCVDEGVVELIPNHFFLITTKTSLTSYARNYIIYDTSQKDIDISMDLLYQWINNKKKPIEIPVRFLKPFLENTKELLPLKRMELNFEDNQFNVDQLEAKISLTLNQGNILLKSSFKYGEFEITNLRKITKENILYRDFQKEQEFQKIMSKLTIRSTQSLTTEETIKSTYQILNIIEILKENNFPTFIDLKYDPKILTLEKVVRKAKVKLSFDHELLEIDLQLGDLEPKLVNEALKYLNEETYDEYIKLSDGTHLKISPKLKEQLKEVNEIINQNNTKVHKAVNLIKTEAKLMKNKAIKLEMDSEVKKLLKKVNELTIQKPKKYKSIATLRDYQKVGVNWLDELNQLGFSGILADDMGLGKTLQVITYIDNCLKKQNNVLIVVPKALLYNWQNELNKFAPHLTNVIIDGSAIKRKNDLEQAIKNKTRIIICAYTSVRQSIEEFKKHQFSHIFLDEAQHIKNSSSQTYKAINELQTSTCFALTGTPIENNLKELWSIFSLILPGLLESKKMFEQEFLRPINKGNKDKMEILKRIVSPFILRRLKKDVLTELPDKIETEVVVNFETKQAKLYNSLHALAVKEVRETILKDEFKNSQIKILSLLNKLRQVCCYPQFIEENYKGENAKFEMLEELATELIESENKILIFSQFTTVLKAAKEIFDGQKINSLYLDGKTKAVDRQKLVDQFNSNEEIKVFFISLKAGGTGLNLTGASAVIHLDPWWNPSVEDQASDRAYRMGQTKNVQVFKIVAKNTIEEKIIELQKKKRLLIGDILDNETKSFKSLGEEEILAIFDIKK